MRVGEKSSDAELVRQVLKGDKNTFSLLYSRHETSLHSFAFNKMHNHEDAKDIVQETFVAIWQNLRELKDPQKFPNWMFGIASRIIAKKYRERQKLIECLSLSRDANEVEISDVAAVLLRIDAMNNSKKSSTCGTGLKGQSNNFPTQSDSHYYCD